mmetsp:Transcript_4950/g.19800  ORF Transcript_4950/g.19800 Transcript_4950/m.19800 type:complete len:219 (-) Transcript_4950:53-709(-)
MGFLLSDLQARWLALWRPSTWVPVLRDMHSAQISYSAQVQPDAYKRLEDDLRRLEQQNRCRILEMRSDPERRQMKAKLFRFFGVLQYVHVVDLDIGMEPKLHPPQQSESSAAGAESAQDTMVVIARSSSCAPLPAWVPLCPILAILLFWLPFPAAEANRTTATKLVQALLNSPKAAGKRSSVVSPQTEFFFFFIVAPCVFIMAQVLQSGIVGRPRDAG